MGVHDAPASWLERWREQEPVRLYLWSVASAVLVGCVVAGWLTRELALAIAGPVSAALMIGGTAGARSLAFAPATVERLQDEHVQELDEAVEEQHRTSWQDGWDAGVEAAHTAVQAWLEEHPEQPATTAMAAQRPCQYVDDAGVRCVLPEHPAQFPHQLEAEPDRSVEGVNGEE